MLGNNAAKRASVPKAAAFFICDARGFGTGFGLFRDDVLPDSCGIADLHNAVVIWFDAFEFKCNFTSERTNKPKIFLSSVDLDAQMQMVAGITNSQKLHCKFFRLFGEDFVEQNAIALA